MKRVLAAAAAVAITAGAGLAATATASSAANAAGAAHVAAKPSIRTFTEQQTITFRGSGQDKSYLSEMTGSESVILGRVLAMKQAQSFLLELDGTHRSTASLVVIGNHSYTRTGNGSWRVKVLSAAAQRLYRQEANPGVELARFFALHGVRRVGAGRYTVTGSLQAVVPFLSWAYGLTAKNFTGADPRAITVSVWTNRDGWPVEIRTTGQAASSLFSVTETFGNYNKSLSISKP